MIRITVLAACLVLVATAVNAQTAGTTDAQQDATLRYGLGGDFAAHGFGRTGFVVADAANFPARWSLPSDEFAMEMFFWWFFFPPHSSLLPLYLTGGATYPGITPRHAWWLQYRELGFRIVVPRCMQVTLYLLDAAASTNLFGAVNIHVNRGEPDARVIRVNDATGGVYVTFTQSVGSANMTIEQVVDSSTAVGILAGAFFDEVPSTEVCSLTRAKTQPFTLESSGGTLLFGAGGNMSRHGFGTRGYYMPASDTQSAATAMSSSQYSVAFSRFDTGAYFHIPSDDRLAVAPVAGAPRRPMAMNGPSGGDLTITVTVPRCSLVRLYVLDLYNNVRSAEVRRPGKPTVRLDHAITQGIWVTFQQDTPVAQYITNKIAGPNIPLLAIAIDDDPTCTVNFERSGQALLRFAAGGNFAALGLGARGYYLGGIIRYPERASLPSGYRVSFPTAPFRAWGHPTVPPAADLWKLLQTPDGGTPRADVWYGHTEVSITVAVPRCTAVTFYFLDWDSSARRFLLRRDNEEALVSVDRSFHDGVYVTVTQSTAEATYTVEQTGGANAVLSGVVMDDLPPADAASCNFAAAPTPAPACTAQSTSDVRLLPGEGGNFRGAVGVGSRGWVLGNRWNVELPQTGYGVAFPQAMGAGWTAAAPSGYPTSRLLTPPGLQPWPECWFATSGFDVVVTVPRCSRVTLYFLDFDSDVRRFSLDQDGVRRVDYTCSFNEGVYITLQQTTATATYSVRRTGGANAVLSGVMFDDHAVTDCILGGSSGSSGGSSGSSGGSSGSSGGSSGSNNNNNNNGADDDDGSNTVLIAVVAGVAVGAVFMAVAIAIVVATRRNQQHADGNIGDAAAGEQAAETGPAAASPVVGQVVDGGASQPGSDAATFAQPQQPQQYAYPPQQGAHTPQHFPGYPAQPSTYGYGYPPQLPASAGRNSDSCGDASKHPCTAPTAAGGETDYTPSNAAAPAAMSGGRGVYDQ